MNEFHKNRENKIKEEKKSKERNKNSLFEMHTIEDEPTSPIKIDVPKKIDLGRKKFRKTKIKFRNHGSVKNIKIKDLNIDNEIIDNNDINKSTKLGCDFHLHKLVEKITLLKNNENTEVKIRENIKKLRHYCYQLRKKKKRVKKITFNYSFRKKLKDKEKKIDKVYFDNRRNTISNKNTLLLFQKKIEKNNLNKSNAVNDTSILPLNQNSYNRRKESYNKILKPIKIYKMAHSSNKNNRYLSSLKPKDKYKNLQILNQTEENYPFLKKSIKKKNKRYLKIESKNNFDENILNIEQNRKELPQSTINVLKMKFDNCNNNDDGKSKKNNRMKHNNKKPLKQKKSVKLLLNKENKDNKNNKESKDVYKYFSNITFKKDKIELHDNLKHHKTCKKIKRFTFRKENSKKSEENKDEIIKLK